MTTFGPIMEDIDDLIRKSHNKNELITDEQEFRLKAKSSEVNLKFLIKCLTAYSIKVLKLKTVYFWKAKFRC